MARREPPLAPLALLALLAPAAPVAPVALVAVVAAAPAACGGNGSPAKDAALADAPVGGADGGGADAPVGGADGGPADAGSVDARAPGDAAVDAGSAQPDASVDAGSAQPDVNGCSRATATDFTATPLVVTFPGLAYAPKCARIRAGQSVTFSGSFASHPLRAGKVVSGVATADPTSPIAATNSGQSAAFTFPAAGAYPYYCAFHYGAGMFGAIYVDP